MDAQAALDLERRRRSATAPARSTNLNQSSARHWPVVKESTGSQFTPNRPYYHIDYYRRSGDFRHETNSYFEYPGWEKERAKHFLRNEAVELNYSAFQRARRDAQGNPPRAPITPENLERNDRDYRIPSQVSKRDFYKRDQYIGARHRWELRASRGSYHGTANSSWDEYMRTYGDSRNKRSYDHYNNDDADLVGLSRDAVEGEHDE